MRYSETISSDEIDASDNYGTLTVTNMPISDDPSDDEYPYPIIGHFDLQTVEGAATFGFTYAQAYRLRSALDMIIRAAEVDMIKSQRAESAATGDQK